MNQFTESKQERIDCHNRSRRRQIPRGWQTLL